MLVQKYEGEWYMLLPNYPNETPRSYGSRNIQKVLKYISTNDLTSDALGYEPKPLCPKEFLL